MPDNIIDSIINHENARDFIRELLNGTSTWLFKVLAQLEPEGKLEEVRTEIGKLVREYLETLYRLQRQHCITHQSYIDFLQKDKEIPKSVMTYLLKTFQTKYDSNFLIATTAVLVALERREEDYRRFLEEFVEVKNAAVNPDSTLMMFHTFVLQNKLSGNLDKL